MYTSIVSAAQIHRLMEVGYDFTEFAAFLKKHGSAWLASEKLEEPPYEMGAQLEPTAEVAPIRCSDNIDSSQEAKLPELGPHESNL